MELVATPSGRKYPGQGVADRVDHRHPQLRARLGCRWASGRRPPRTTNAAVGTLAVISFVLIGLWAIVAQPSWSPGPPSRPPSRHTVAPLSTVPGDQPHGPLRKAKRVAWDQLKTGDCFNGFADTAGWKTPPSGPPRVDCRSPHKEEVTGTFALPGGDRYPGDAAVVNASDARAASGT